MNKYLPNKILILTMISMALIISSSIVDNYTTEVGLLISGWVMLFTAIVMYVLKIKKKDEE
jgi:amino acid transporter